MIKRFCLLHHFILLPPHHQPYRARVRRSSSSRERRAQHIARHLRDAKKRVVLADFRAARWECGSKIEQLIHIGGLPSAIMMSGKSVIDETLPGFLGTYAGAASEPGVREAVESADALIAVGTFFFDLGTAGFSHKIDPRRFIDIQPFSASVAGVRYPDVPMACALECVIEEIRHLDTRPTSFPAVGRKTPVSVGADEPLTQTNF
ncbi:hypothetical protein [Paraburkholderia fungorum]|uniref:hypothetical protein n=1 Tax=Paraburkholderia fungorum TaxID=134537 RepID=UPI0038BBF5DB